MVFLGGWVVAELCSVVRDSLRYLLTYLLALPGSRGGSREDEWRFRLRLCAGLCAGFRSGPRSVKRQSKDTQHIGLSGGVSRTGKAHGGRFQTSESTHDIGGTCYSCMYQTRTAMALTMLLYPVA